MRVPLFGRLSFSLAHDTVERFAVLFVDVLKFERRGGDREDQELFGGGRDRGGIEIKRTDTEEINDEIVRKFHAPNVREIEKTSGFGDRAALADDQTAVGQNVFATKHRSAHHKNDDPDREEDRLGSKPRERVGSLLERKDRKNQEKGGNEEAKHRNEHIQQTDASSHTSLIKDGFLFVIKVHGIPPKKVNG